MRDCAGDTEVVEQFAVTIERAGATPIIELLSPDHLRRVLTLRGVVAPSGDNHREKVLELVDRILVLQGADFSGAGVDANIYSAWKSVRERLETVAEMRHIPTLIVAIPTRERAGTCSISIDDLTHRLDDAFAFDQRSLRTTCDAIVRMLKDASSVEIRSGQSGRDVLRLDLGGRPLLVDDGVIDDEDVAHGAIVSNWPGGSVYTTVVENSANGVLTLDSATLRFEEGRVTAIQGAFATRMLAMFKRHDAGASRISHFGIGTNLKITESIGWPLVDEHRAGAVFIAFGENRYLGGENASSLNVDFVIPNASVLAGGRTVVDSGQLLGPRLV